VSIEVKNKGKIKPNASRQHATMRARERYNIDLSAEDIERLELRIRLQGGDAFFLERSSRKRSIWLVRVEGCNCVVVYNNAQKCVSTFLPVWYAKRYLNGDSDWIPNSNCED
jgi:hypothetical protein